MHSAALQLLSSVLATAMSANLKALCVRLLTDRGREVGAQDAADGHGGNQRAHRGHGVVAGGKHAASGQDAAEKRPAEFQGDINQRCTSKREGSKRRRVTGGHVKVHRQTDCDLKTHTPTS